jgi:uncharacterized protein (DUF433 family)
VDDVLGWLGNGMSSPDIIEDFPELSEAMIRACLRYRLTGNGIRAWWRNESAC